MNSQERFARNIEGKEVRLITLKNNRNTQLCLTNYGCRIVSLLVHDKAGKPVDVVVGFDSINGYLTATEVYHGATIGRYSNRIAKGRFELEGQSYSLAINNELNHLHGGPEGFHTRVWTVDEASETKASLSYLSPDGEEGYPGNLQVSITFELTEENEVVIRYLATTDKKTILNLTNHAYFNLNGQGSGTILHHTLELAASRFTPVDENLIPTGEIQDVQDTPFDFRTPVTIGKRINEDHIQLQYGNGYDHNYVLDNGGKLALAARATADKTGLVMETYTDQPGIQFYTGNFMSGENIIKGHVPDHFRTAFCLETQHFPDSPNHPHFPSTELSPGERFESTTIYRFM